MRRVLVTGATTPVGIGLVERLLRDPDVELVMAVGIDATWPGAAPSARFHYYSVDLTRVRQMNDLLFGPAAQHEVDVIVHMALHRSAINCGRRVHLLNVECTRELLSMAERHPTVRRFVFRSFAETYDLGAGRPTLIGEDHPLNLAQNTPQWLRDRIEADLNVCTRMGLTTVRVAVLRCAECLAPGTGSQLHDYLRSRLCLKPMGFDPMLNLLSTADLVEALYLAAGTLRSRGVFNIPGADTLPLSEVIRRHGRQAVPLPSPLLGPLYTARHMVHGTQFRYDLNYFRFHQSGVLDGRRARQRLGYEPRHPLTWPRGASAPI